CVAGAVLAGCGGSGAGSASDAAARPPDLAMEVCSSDGMPVALAAHYGVKVTLNVNVKVPSNCSGDACLYDMDAISELLMLQHVVQVGQMVTTASRPCHFKIPVVTLKSQKDTPTKLDASDALVRTVKVAPSVSMLD